MKPDDMINALFQQALGGVSGWLGDLFTTYTGIFAVLLLVSGGGLVTYAMMRGADEEAGFARSAKKGPWLDDRNDSMELSSGYGDYHKPRNSAYDEDKERSARAKSGIGG